MGNRNRQQRKASRGNGLRLVVSLVSQKITNKVIGICKKIRKRTYTRVYEENSLNQSGNGNGKQMGVMRESYIEKRFCEEAKKRGMWAVKFVSPGLSGVPDRIVLIPGGRAAFVELKAPGEVLRPIQERRKKQLETLGFTVYVVDDTERIEGVLDEIQRT